MKKIWIVSEVFYPETVATAYIMTEIAKYLALEYNVNVISGPAFYNLDNQNNDEDINLEGVNIIRTSNKGYNKNLIISRVIGSFMVSYKMLVLSRKEIPNNSEILLVTNPAVLVFSFCCPIICFDFPYLRRNRLNLFLLMHCSSC